SAVLDWSEQQAPEHAEVLDLYRRLIALRGAEPDLADGNLALVDVQFDEDARWLVVHRGAFRVAANLASDAQVVPGVDGELVLATDDAKVLDDGVLLAAQSAAIIR